MRYYFFLPEGGSGEEREIKPSCPEQAVGSSLPALKHDTPGGLTLTEQNCQLLSQTGHKGMSNHFSGQGPHLQSPCNSEGTPIAAEALTTSFPHEKKNLISPWPCVGGPVHQQSAGSAFPAEHSVPLLLPFWFLPSSSLGLSLEQK